MSLSKALCTTQMCGCKPVLYLHILLHVLVGKQFSVDTEQAEVSLFVVHHAVSLSGGLHETRPHTPLWGT